MTFPRGIEVVGSAIIENEKGEILLAQSPKWQNKWTLPGGHLEPGETIMEVAAREAEEETGLKTRPIAVIHWGELINPPDFHRPAHFIYFDSYCKVVGGALKLDNRELSTYQWVAPHEALKLDLATTYPETIKEFIKYLESESKS